MKKLRYGLIVMWMLMCSVISAEAQVSIGIGLPNVSIGINLPLFPELVPVPGYPVYYAPQLDSNYFFYDGMYWVYQNDNWYASSWYNGPWAFVEPTVVPVFILRVPVRYYRQPPVYFRGWQSNAPPRWGQHWGRGWEQHRRGWDRWNRSSAPARAPLPVYQRQYSGDRYPRQLEQQHSLRSQSYRYQPRDKVVREHFKGQQAEHRAPAAGQRGRQEAPPARRPGQDDQRQQREQKQQIEQRQQREQKQQIDQRQQREQRPQVEQRPQREQSQQPRAAQPQPPRVVQPQPQQPRAAQPQREQQAPKAQEREQRPQDRGASQEPNQGRGQGQGRDDDRGRGRDDDRGRGRDK